MSASGSFRILHCEDWVEARQTSILSILFFFSIVASFPACNNSSHEPPVPLVATIDLAVSDVGVTEAWLRVSIDTTIASKGFSLRRNNEVVLTSQIAAAETVVIDEGLLPNATYTYKAYRVDGLTDVDSSGYLNVSTMDTTNHQMVFQFDTLGIGGSILYDIAILNDTLAYAVGEIYVLDSLGQIENPPKNIAKWDGQQWELMTLFYNYQGQDVYMELRSIFALTNADIWFAGNGLVKWDGSQYVQIEIPSTVWGSFLVNEVAARSASDLYVVGGGGSIARYNGITWTRLSSGTVFDVWDIVESTNQVTGEQGILCVASDIFGGGGSEVMSISGSTVTRLSDIGLTSSLSGIWFEPGKRYYTVGSGVAQKRTLSDSTWETYPPGVVTSYYSEGTRGTGINDVFVVGSFMEIVHFNGMTWRNYGMEIPPTPGVLGAVAVSQKLIIAVGYQGGSAVAVLGLR